MKQTFIDTHEDLMWLHYTHGTEVYFDRTVRGWGGTRIVPEWYVAAMIYGNEDDPEKVELYTQDHYRSDVTVYERNDDGKLIKIKQGKFALRKKRKGEAK